MTLPSRGKRRTTRRSIRRAIRREPLLRWAALLAVLFATTVSVGEETADKQPQAPRKTEGKVSLAPLERLKVRSPNERWQKLHQLWLKSRSEAGTTTATSQAEPISDVAAVNQPVEAPVETEELPVPEIPPIEESLPLLEDDLDLPPDLLRPSPLPGLGLGDETGELQVERFAEPVRDPRLLKPVREIKPFVILPEPGALPEEIELPEIAYAPRTIAPMYYPWAASDVWYQPLYFEDIVLERYGHVFHNPLVTELYALGKFSVQFLALPYQMTLKPIWARIYPLGYYRPGDYVPYYLYQPPLNLQAAVNEAAVVTGLFYLLP